jgi:hypothetical protein
MQFLRAYQVLNEWGDDLHEQVPIAETFYPSRNDCDKEFAPTSGSTYPDGHFGDQFALCARACCDGPGCEADAIQAWSSGNTVLQYFTDQWRCDGFQISP